MSRTCLIEKLSHHVDVNDIQADLLEGLERERRTVAADALIHSAGDRVDSLYVLRSGWLYSYSYLPDGSRQVLHLHYPGDIIGLADIPFAQTTHYLRTASESVICPFPKRSLDEVFVHAPALACLLFSIGMVDHAVLADRMRIMGRMGARERVAHFLLEMISRMRITSDDGTDEYEIPLTQSLIGDAVGLTNVYVSRALAQLHQRGWISRQQRRVRLLDEDALRASVDFSDRHFKIDTSWFPTSA